VKITLKSIAANGRELHPQNCPVQAPPRPSQSLRPVPSKDAGHLRCTRWPRPCDLPSPQKSSTTSRRGGGVRPVPTCPVQLQFRQGSFWFQLMTACLERQAPL